MELDQKLFIWINSFAGKSSIVDNLASILCSDHFFPVLLSLLLLGLWFGSNNLKNRVIYQKCVFISFIGLAIANLNVALVNFIFFRDRPFNNHEVTLLFYEPTDSSFPSNAIAATTALACGIWIANKRLGSISFGAVLIFGFIRIFSGIHYPIDILGGLLIGILSTVVARYIIKLLDPIVMKIIKAGRILILA
ncbi:MAG: phosphatase PAP2 family protein [SAR202 cluster bacterium]|nr:phosphatase PAP2 family protein [SAR202 cluster bacterium]